jgi:AAA+ ATPase superfamily predicted ATPase
MVRLFEDSKEALFGRLDAKLNIRPFAVKVCKQILADYNPSYTPEDLLCMYMLTGGVPKYVGLLMEAGAHTKDEMLGFAARLDSPFIGEGKDLLLSEFGRDYSIYFSILMLIATGMTKQHEIDSCIGKNTGAYMENLESKYTLVKKSRPIFSKPGSRNIRWKISDPFLRFWFRFVFRCQSFVETGRHDLLLEEMQLHYNEFSGLALEQYFTQQISEQERFTQIGGYWDARGENEIDIIAIDEHAKKAIICEVKRNPRKIDLHMLQTKAATINRELAEYTVEYRALSMGEM